MHFATKVDNKRLASHISKVNFANNTFAAKRMLNHGTNVKKAGDFDIRVGLDAR
jgi:UDP-N-acetylglucosamine 2-epimerase